MNAPKDRLTVPDAAKLLGVTPEAIRQRIRRGTIEHEQDENGRYFVYTSPTEGVENNLDNGVENGVQNGSQALHDHIETLKRELELRNEELRRKDHILAALVNRVPELEAAPEQRNGSETASDPRSGTPNPTISGPHSGAGSLASSSSSSRDCPCRIGL